VVYLFTQAIATPINTSVGSRVDKRTVFVSIYPIKDIFTTVNNSVDEHISHV